MQVKNIISNSIKGFKAELDKIRSSGFEATLAIVFSDSKIDNLEVASILEESNIEYVACSSVGEIVKGASYEDSISASIFSIDKSYFHVVKQKVQEDESYNTGIELGKIAMHKFTHPSFISLFAIGVHGEKIIAGLKDVLGTEPNMYGGMAADETGENPYVFTHDEKNNNGLHTIILDSDKIDVNGFAISGWESLGTEHRITKSKDNIIYEINDEPALDFFKKFFGFYADPLAMEKGVVATVNAQYPLQINRDNEFVLRAPLNSDEANKTLTMAGPVHQGETFKFSVAPGFEVIDETIEEFKKFKNEIEKPDAIILFSCKARHWAFGPMIENELEALNELWDVPFQGFFSFGEIGKNKNQHTHFFNETCCLITLKEK